MTADEPASSHTGRSGALGALGLGLWVLGLIIAFVVAVEYDPAEAEFRDAAERSSATVRQVDGGFLIATTDAAAFTVAIDERAVGRFEPGDPVSLLAIPGQADGARLEEDVPVSPRRARDAAAPIVLLVLGALVVAADPAVLYPAVGSTAAQAS